MKATSRIKLNMIKPDPTVCLSAVQEDAYSRSLNISLYSGFSPWMIPEGVTITIR